MWEDRSTWGKPTQVTGRTCKRHTDHTRCPDWAQVSGAVRQLYRCSTVPPVNKLSCTTSPSLNPPPSHPQTPELPYLRSLVPVTIDPHYTTPQPELKQTFYFGTIHWITNLNYFTSHLVHGFNIQFQEIEPLVQESPIGSSWSYVRGNQLLLWGCNLWASLTASINPTC